jgi:amino acid transporter
VYIFYGFESCVFYGFESCGDIAEETRDAGRRIPRAMRLARAGAA